MDRNRLGQEKGREEVYHILSYLTHGSEPERSPSPSHFWPYLVGQSGEILRKEDEERSQDGLDAGHLALRLGDPVLIGGRFVVVQHLHQPHAGAKVLMMP